EGPLLERAGEPLEIALVEVCEEGNSPQELYRCLSHCAGFSADSRLCGFFAACELLDTPFGGMEPVFTEPVELLAPLPELQRLVERRLAALEPVDDLLELLLGRLDGLFFGHRVSSTRAPKPPSASSTSTLS